MPKGVQRGNKEVKKPKKDRTPSEVSTHKSSPPPVAIIPKRSKSS